MSLQLRSAACVTSPPPTSDMEYVQMSEKEANTSCRDKVVPFGEGVHAWFEKSSLKREAELLTWSCNFSR